MSLLISLAIVGVVVCITGIWLLFYVRRNQQLTIKPRQEAIWAITLKKKGRRKR